MAGSVWDRACGGASRIARCYTPVMTEGTVKEQMLRAIERLPDDATLDDVAHVLKMHELLARARADRALGLGLTSDQLRERYGIAREG